MDASSDLSIDPMLSLFEVEKISERTNMDTMPVKEKQKEIILTNKRGEGFNDLIAALFFVQEKVLSEIREKNLIR